MQTVYLLSKELEDDPEQVRSAHELTLDKSRPHMGLKGKNGLFGSDDWWAAIAGGTIETEKVSGTILKVYRVGMEAGDLPNEIELRSDDGQVNIEGVYVNKPEDASAYRPGRRIEFLYAIDELKRGGETLIVLEVRLGDEFC